MSDEDRDRYDAWLDADSTVLGIGAGRHDATKFKICSYYWKYKSEWMNLSDDDRFERAWQWHLKHCIPPRSRKEFDSLCDWVKKKYRVKRDKFFDEIRYQKQKANQADSEFSSLPPEVQTRLSAHVHSLIGRNPLRFYVADGFRKEILKVVIARPKDVIEKTEDSNTTTTTTTKIKTIKYTEKDTIIDANNRHNV